jgi:hypothetical protein
VVHEPVRANSSWAASSSLSLVSSFTDIGSRWT